MSQVRAALQPRTLGRYNLIERLGAGGQGEVWRAHDGMRGVDVALKILAPALAQSPAAWAALEHEHAISTRMQHAGILQLMPPERLDGYVALPMELADGGNLSRLRGEGYLTIVPVLLEIARALEHAHRHGVVHRDLKPGNVLFDERGRVKVADFGVAALLETGVQRSDAATQGLSPFTASPAQLRGEPPSIADDVYGFGALAYELLAGRPPHFPNFDAARVQAGPVPPLVPTRQAPVQLIELVMRMLDPSPGQRPATMAQVIDELEGTLNCTQTLDPGGPVSDPPLPPGSVAPIALPTLGPAEASVPRLAGSATAPAAASPHEPAPPHTPMSSPVPASEPAPAGPPPVVPIMVDPQPLSTEELLRVRLQGMPQRYATRSPRGQSPREPGNPRGKSSRLGYLLFGLVCGAMMAVAGLSWLSSQDLRASPLKYLSTFASGVLGGHLLPVRRPAAAASSATPAADGERLLAAQRAEFDRRLSALSSRGVTTWDASDFAAARIQEAETIGAQEAGGMAVARQHWRQAQKLLATMEAKAPQALASELKSGRAALREGHRRAAARAFALALRIDPGDRRAMSGARRAPPIASARPTVRAGRRTHAAHPVLRLPVKTGRAHLDTRFRDAGYAKAVRAGLAAFGDGRLYEAQADFEQALVYRHHGSEATKALDQVNAALRARAAKR